jgi:hypothetical protein
LFNNSIVSYLLIKEEEMEKVLIKLPSNWDEVTLLQFQSLLQLQITENEDYLNGFENTLKVISALSGIDVTVLEEQPMKEIVLMGAQLSFITNQPEHKKSDIKWKAMDEITYDDFVTFISDPDYLSNLSKFIKLFSLTTLTEEEILQLPITEVLYGFFLFRKGLKKYLKGLIQSTQKQLQNQKQTV